MTPRRWAGVSRRFGPSKLRAKLHGVTFQKTVIQFTFCQITLVDKRLKTGRKYLYCSWTKPPDCVHTCVTWAYDVQVMNTREDRIRGCARARAYAIYSYVHSVCSSAVNSWRQGGANDKCQSGQWQQSAGLCNDLSCWRHEWPRCSFDLLLLSADNGNTERPMLQRAAWIGGTRSGEGEMRRKWLRSV